MIAFETVRKRYGEDGPYVVDQTRFRVRDGQLLLLLANSGSGKTTAVKMNNRLIEPTGGRILIRGHCIAHGDSVKLRRGIGYIIQGVGLFPHLTVGENIAILPEMFGPPADRISRRIDELLGLVQLPVSYRTRAPSSLSRGERQRVGFARAIATQPKSILLVEPFAVLDPLTRDDVRSQFLGLHKRLGLTAVMVTHDMTEALLSADRIAALRMGRLIRIGTPCELISEPGDEFDEELLSTSNKHRELLGFLWTGAA